MQYGLGLEWVYSILNSANVRGTTAPSWYNIRRVNKAMRAVDDSNLWPILGRFNVTDRAIRRARRHAQEIGGYGTVKGYVARVDYEIGRIVNDPRTLPSMSY